MGKDIIPPAVEIANLKLESPLVISSGCFEYSQEMNNLFALDVFGALVSKTITLDEREGNPLPRTCEVSAGLINSIGLQNQGLYHYIREVLPRLKNSLHLPLITSIAGSSLEEFAMLASHLDREEGVSAIEVNISCPNLEREEDGIEIFSQDPIMSYGIVKAVRESTSKPIIVKLSPEVTDIRSIALAVEDAGCDAITVANSYPAMAIDIKTRRSKLGSLSGGLSGPAIKPLTLKKVWEVYSTVKLPVIASGGIMKAEDALEYIIAGATLLSLGTVNFINPRAGEEILQGIQKYLEENKLTYSELIGALQNE